MGQIMKTWSIEKNSAEHKFILAVKEQNFDQTTITTLKPTLSGLKAAYQIIKQNPKYPKRGTMLILINNAIQAIIAV